MANTIITPDMIAMESLLQLENNLVLANKVYRDYESELVGTKIGESIRVRRPVQFVSNTGPTLVNQDVEEAYTTMSITGDEHVAFKFTARDLSMSIDKFSERYITPAMVTLANKIDSDGFALYKELFHTAGTPGTTPNSYDSVSNASVLMDEVAVPDDGNRCLITDPNAAAKIAGSIPGLQTMADPKAVGAFERNTVGMISTFNHYKSQNIKRHTVGALGGTPLVNGASQNVTYAAATANGVYQQSLVTDGWSNSVSDLLKAGDTFTIAGVNSVNPVAQGSSKQDTGRLQSFTVLADVDSDGSGNATLTISPAIITSGPYQTVTAAPADNAAITITSGSAGTSYPQNMAIHKNCLGFAMAKLQDYPAGAQRNAGVAMSQKSRNGFTVNLFQQFDITNRQEVWRLDVLYAWKTLDARLGVRLFG